MSDSLLFKVTRPRKSAGEIVGFAKSRFITARVVSPAEFATTTPKLPPNFIKMNEIVISLEDFMPGIFSAFKIPKRFKWQGYEVDAPTYFVAGHYSARPRKMWEPVAEVLKFISANSESVSFCCGWPSLLTQAEPWVRVEGDAMAFLEKHAS